MKQIKIWENLYNEDILQLAQFNSVISQKISSPTNSLNVKKYLNLPSKKIPTKAPFKTFTSKFLKLSYKQSKTV